MHIVAFFNLQVQSFFPKFSLFLSLKSMHALPPDFAFRES